MREVAIVGAGELGGLVAHTLMRQKAADRVRLIDNGGRVAEGKALDISQAAPVEGFVGLVTGSADLSDAAGADVVVIAERVGSPGSAGKPGSAATKDWVGDEALTLVRQLNAIAPRALFSAQAFHTAISTSGAFASFTFRAPESLDPPARRSSPRRPPSSRSSSTFRLVTSHCPSWAFRLIRSSLHGNTQPSPALR
jgi:hypothetical protein